MKYNLITIILSGFIFYACQSSQEATKGELVTPQSSPSEKERSLKAGLNLLDQSQLREQFYGQDDKDWRDMLAFHKKWHGKFGEDPNFTILESKIYLLSFVEEPKSPCPNCRFEYDGSEEMREALEYYAKHFEEFPAKAPRLTYYFMKELAKIRNEAEMKAYAAQIRDYLDPFVKEMEEELSKDAKSPRAEEMTYYNKIKEWAS